MFKVNREKCIACMQCINDCPTIDILLKDNKAYIKNERCIKCGHCIAICPTKAVSTDDYDMSDVKEYNEHDFTIESERLLNFIKFRRSVRRFKNVPVEKYKINKIIEAGRFTQTSTNSQNVSYIVVSEKIDEFKKIAYESLKQKGDYILSNLTPETEYLEKYANIWVNNYKSFIEDPIKNDRLLFNAPVAIFVVSDTPINGGLASSNMELMTDALGLGTFFSGFLLVAIKDNPNLLDFLSIDNSDKIISCLVIGYPAIKYKRTVPRKAPSIKWL